MPPASTDILAKITISRVAQALAVGSAVGAITSVIFNMLRFQRWGLSFTDIATTADIVMSGITVGLALIKIGIVILIGIVLTEGIVTILSWLLYRFGLQDEANSKRVSAICAFVILTVLVLFFIVLEWRHVLNISSISLSVALTVGLLSGGLIDLLLFSSHDHFVIKDRFLRYIPALFIVVAAVVGVKLQMQQNEENPLRWISPSNFCLGAPIVVWVGSASVVSRCSTSARTFTYIVTDRATGILGRRRAITRFTRDRRTEKYRPILNRRDGDWRLVPNVATPLYVDRSSILIEHGHAQFIAAYFPNHPSMKKSSWPGTKVQVSDQTVQCLFPYSDHLISLIAYSKSDRRIRLDETEEDQRYDNSLSRWRYQISQFVCERSASGLAMDATQRLSLDKVMNGQKMENARQIVETGGQ